MNLLQTILDSYELIKDKMDKVHVLHHFNTTLEGPIFAELKRRYLSSLQSWWSSYSIPSYQSTNKSIFVYETREHPNLEFLILNTTYFARDWSLHIVCSRRNEAFVRKILSHNENKAFLNVLENTDDTYENGRNQYNAYMKSSQLWNSIPSHIQWVLTAEVDSYLRKPIPNDMFQFDFCASLWVWADTMPGGGGLSFRSVDAMRLICRELPQLADEEWSQDGWASKGIQRLGRSYNATYFMESCMQPDAIGVHQWWSFCVPLDDERLQCFEEYMKCDILN